MKIILLSGGSGKRLWPLSNEARSKQFLRMLEDENGEFQSMVQRVWGQLTKADLAKDALISTSQSQVDILNNQLDEQASLIIEPARMDTFPAIALASSYCHSELKASDQESIIVLPVDSYVKDDFFEKVKELDKAVQSKQNDANIVLMGVEPSFPSSKYGYMIPNKSTSQQHSDLLRIHKFIEKPEENIAEELITQHALWNCGVFAFKLGYLIDLLKTNKIPTDYRLMRRQYTNMEKNSFDYAVLEQEEKIYALPYEGSWKDLGTWNTMTDEMGHHLIGKGVVGDEVKNSHLINMLEMPVVLSGLSDVVVAASPDGILVSAKETSPQIKDLIADFNADPMYEETCWGWSKVIDLANYGTEEMITRRVGVKAGKNLAYCYHQYCNETWTIIKGSGDFIADNQAVQKIKSGDTIHIQAGKGHALLASEDIEMIVVAVGEAVTPDDRTIVCEEWQDIMNLYYQTAPRMIM